MSHDVAVVGADVRERARGILGWRPTNWAVVTGGYSPAARYRVRRGSDTAFVKVATSASTARLLCREIAVYRSVRAPFMPDYIGHDTEDGVEPLLVIEDLGDAFWPPPWRDDRVAAVRERLATMHQTKTDLPERHLLLGRDPGWPSVAADPQPLLSLGLITDTWLDRCLADLLVAESSCPLEGQALTHLDLRSDNMCISHDGVKFIDWAEAGRSNAEVDIGFWLPSLAHEGGPAPEAVLPDAPQIAALVSGFFAARAGLPIIAEAPLVRRVQIEQLTTALPWAIRALGLPPADGPAFRGD